MSLSPLLSLLIVVLKTLECLINEFNITSHSNFFPVFSDFGLENFIGLFESGEEKSNRVSSAFFIRIRQVLENRVPSVFGSVPSGNFFFGDRVDKFRIKILFAIFTFLKKFSASMTQKFVEDDLVENHGSEMFSFQSCVFFTQILNDLRRSDGVSKVNVLESFVLSNIVVVGNVDSQRSSRRSEG